MIEITRSELISIITQKGEVLIPLKNQKEFGIFRELKAEMKGSSCCFYTITFSTKKRMVSTIVKLVD